MNSIKILLITTLAIALSNCGTTKKRSTTTVKDPMISKAEKAITEKSYQKAIKLFDKALQTDTKNVYAMLGKSSVYYILKNLSAAKKEIQTAIHTNPNYNADMYYSLGIINEQMENYDEAANNYGQYLSHHPTKKKRINKARKKQEQCQFISQAIANPVSYNPILLDNNINTDASEYWAVMSADNRSFVFTRRVNRQEDLFISEWKNPGFIPALTMPWNTDKNEAAHCISPDGNLIIFTRCDARDSKGGCDLYYTQYKNGKWSNPKNMGYPINSPAWDSQPSLSSDGKTLIYSSKRKETNGKSDIFISHLKNRKWSTPTKISSNINTAGSDESPYLHPDGQTLYFRSNGHPGMGDFDIFYVKKDPYTQVWGTPVNIGYPINTKGSDGALTVAYDGKTAFYATDYFSIKAGKTPNLDIVQFELPLAARSTPVSYAKLHISDAKTSKPISTIVEFYTLNNNQLLYKSKSNNEGNLLVSLITGKEYLININNKKYSFYSQNINFTDNSTSESTVTDYEVRLIPIEEKIEISKKEIVLNNIFFESGSAILLPTSLIEIQNLKVYLASLPTMKIKIIGHTDNVGAPSDNMTLSQNRAKAVYQALIKEGIIAHRLSYIGKGENAPIADNNTDQGRRRNRRTSFIITK